MAKLAFLAVMVLLVTALVASSPARATDVRPCPAPPLTVDELLALAGDAGYAGFAGQLNPDGLACYGASDVMVVGFVHEPDGLGGTGAVVIEPTWLTEWGLFLAVVLLLAAGLGLIAWIFRPSRRRLGSKRPGR